MESQLEVGSARHVPATGPKGLRNIAKLNPGFTFTAPVLVAIQRTVNSLISDLSVVLDSGANSPSGMLHASKGIADVSG